MDCDVFARVVMPPWRLMRWLHAPSLSGVPETSTQTCEITPAGTKLAKLGNATVVVVKQSPAELREVQTPVRVGAPLINGPTKKLSLMFWNRPTPCVPTQRN